MQLRNLRIFAAVAETLSFREGAAMLGVRQPTVSRQIRDLEDALGVDLFERHPGEGVRLTPAGRHFLPKALRMLTDFDSARAEAAHMGQGQSGCLSIAFTASLAGGQLRELLGTFHRDHPDIHLHLSEGNATDQVLALKERAADVGFIADSVTAPNTESETLWLERLHVVLPQDHPLAGSIFIGWQDIKHELFLVRAYPSGQGIESWLLRRFSEGGYSPRIVLHAVSRENLIGLVAAGLGITVVYESATAVSYPGIVFRPLRDDGASRPITMTWLPENANPALRRFLALAHDLARAAQSQVPAPAPLEPAG